MTYTGFRPDQFNRAMTLEDVNSLVGGTPLAGGEIEADLMEDAEVHRYESGLVVAFQGGKLICAFSEPMFPRESE